MGLPALRLYSREEFELWFSRDREIRNELYQILEIEPTANPASLDVLEGYLLRRFGDAEMALSLGERGIVDAAARHIGLIMVLNVDGATWDIDLRNSEWAHYGLPIIRLADGGEECPLSLALACLERRSGHFLRGLVGLLQEDYRGATAPLR